MCELRVSDVNRHCNLADAPDSARHAGVYLVKLFVVCVV